VALASDASAPLFAWAVIGGFGLTALAMLAYAAYITLRYLKYGDPILVFAQMPVVLGGQFVALLAVRRHLIAEQGIALTLKCTERLTTGSGKHAHTKATVLHEEAKTITEDMAQDEAQGSAIPVTFNVPADKPPRDANGNPSSLWTLEARAATPGIDFAAEFDLPVYAVTDPSLIEARPAEGSQQA